VLYAIDLARRDPAASPGSARLISEEAFEKAAAHFELPHSARRFAEELVAGVMAHREALDEQLRIHATNWRLERMAAVDRNVLRLAAYELLYTDTPREVLIDEAVDLARRFGGDRSPGFVNGILDALARAGEAEA
jgi:N utilization substance protein B